MYFNLLLIILVSIVHVKPQEDDLSCPCDTDEDRQDKQLLWDWLKTRDAAEDLTEEEKTISPGLLHQFDCRPCDAEERKNSGVISETEFEKLRRLEAMKQKAEEQIAEEIVEENYEDCDCKADIVDMRCPIDMCWNVLAKKCTLKTKCLPVRI